MIRTIMFYGYITYLCFRWAFLCSFGKHEWKRAKFFDGFWCKYCYARGKARYYRVQDIEEIEAGDDLSVIIKNLKVYL